MIAFSFVPTILLLSLMVGSLSAQTHPGALPRFEDYPARDIFNGISATPKLATPLEQTYADQIRDGVENGYGVFRDGKEQKGPNFSGRLVVIQWACGAPCLRMAI